jgi:hypothetical protein
MFPDIVRCALKRTAPPGHPRVAFDTADEAMPEASM